MHRHFQEIWRVLRDFLAFSEITRLDEVGSGTLRNFLYHGRHERGWSPKTLHNYRQYLGSFFKWCHKRGYLQKNPIDAIEKPILEKRLPRCLSREEARKVLFHASWFPWRYEFEKTRNPSIIATFLFTGIRLQELINLNVTDVDWAGKQLFIRQGKGRKDRLAPIHGRLLPILKSYLNEKIRLGKSSDCLFPGMYSESRLGPKNIRTMCGKIGREAGVKFTPHMLRHTFAREMIENDFPIFKLKEILGHNNVTTTQIYLSVSQRSIHKSFKTVSLY